MDLRPEPADGITGSDDPVLIISRDGRLRFSNPAATALYELPLGAHLPHPLPAIEESVLAWSGVQLRIRRQPVEWMGEVAWLLTITDHRPVLEEQARLLALEADNQRLQADNQRLQRLVCSDPLTGLLNRRGLAERLAGERSRLERGSGRLTAVLIDLDDFKAINDVAGYAAGDRALVSTATAMRGALRNSDVLSRIGGDEFLLLLPQTGLTAAEQVAERLRRSIENLGFTASLGIMELDTEATELVTILPRIQGALSESKGRGKNRVTLMSPEAAPAEGPRFETLWSLDSRSVLAEQCRPCPGGGLAEALLLLDACARRSGSTPLHVPIQPGLLLSQPALLDPFRPTRPWLIALSTASLSDEVLPLRSLLPGIRTGDRGLSLVGVTGSPRGLEAMVLLRPEVVILHPRMLTCRTPGVLERLCETAHELGCAIFADGINSEDLLRKARDFGIQGGAGQLLQDSPVLSPAAAIAGPATR